jgi:hypothetical protein
MFETTKPARPILPDQQFQYTIVGIITDKDPKEERFFFTSYGTPESVLTYISNMSKGTNKVHAIYRMDVAGEVVQMTVGFKDGRLGLIIL